MITINIAENAPIPICPLNGHNWGEVVHKHDVTWLCSYKDDTINPNSTHKYIFLAANSKFKGIRDREKYEKARKLKVNNFLTLEPYWWNKKGLQQQAREPRH